MVCSSLQSLLRPSKNRLTDRAAFVQAVSRLSNIKAKKDEHAQKSARDEQEAA